MGQVKSRGRVLKASTMVELLVTMIVAGVVLLAAMQGLGLFMRLGRERAAALAAHARIREGIARLESLAARTDSLAQARDGAILYAAQRTERLTLADSVLLFRRGDFADTLLVRVAELRVVAGDDAPDTLALRLRGGKGMLTLRLAVRGGAAKRYRTRIERMERESGYEE